MSFSAFFRALADAGIVYIFIGVVIGVSLACVLFAVTSRIARRNRALADAGIVYIFIGAVIGVILACVLFAVIRRIARRKRVSHVPGKGVRDPEEGANGLPPLPTDKVAVERAYVERHSFKNPANKLEVLSSEDSAGSGRIGTGAAYESASAPYDQVTIRNVSETEDAHKPVVQVGMTSMRTFSLNRLLSLAPPGAPKGRGSKESGGEIGGPYSPTRRPKSNLGRDFGRQESLGRSMSSLWAKLHRGPADTMALGPMRSQNSFAIAAHLAGSKPFARAGAGMATTEDDEEAPSSPKSHKSNDNASSPPHGHPGDATEYWPEQEEDNHRSAERNATGMPRIVVRNATVSREGSFDGSLAEDKTSTNARVSSDAAVKGMRRRSRASRVSADSTADALPTSQVFQNMLFEDVDLTATGDGAGEEEMAVSLVAGFRHPHSGLPRSGTSNVSNLTDVPAADDEPQAAPSMERRLRVVPLADMHSMQEQADMMLVLILEEVLPRPGAGLLSRMLRLAPVELACNPGGSEPVLLLHADSQYQLSTCIYQGPKQTNTTISKCYVSLRPSSGQSLYLGLDAEEVHDDDEGIWRGSVTWDVKASDLPEPEIASTTGRNGKNSTSVDFSFDLVASTESGAPLHLIITPRLHVKQVARGAPALENFRTADEWECAADILEHWQYPNPEWDGAVFPFLLAET